MQACSLSLARRILEAGVRRSTRCSALQRSGPGPEAPLSLNNFYGPSEAGIGATIYEEISSTSIN